MIASTPVPATVGGKFGLTPLTRNALLAMSVVAGLVLTGWGLGRFPWSMQATWMGAGALTRFVLFLGGMFCAVIVAARWTNRPASLFALVAMALWAAGANALWPFLWVSVLAMSAWSLGRSLYRLLGIDSQQIDDVILLLSGAGLFGTAVGLAAHWRINYPIVYACAVALPLLLQRQALLEKLSRLYAALVERKPSAEWRAIDSAIAAVALVHFVVALLPEHGVDALSVHLFVPAQLAHRHEWGFDPVLYVWAVMPMLGDWLYALAYMVAGETAARLLNVGSIFVLAFLVAQVVRWAGGGAFAARLAALLLLSTPLTFTLSSSLFIESVWAVFLIGGGWCVLRLSEAGGQGNRWLVPSALLLGCAMAAKLLTLTWFPVLGLLFLWRRSGWLGLGHMRLLLPSLVLFLAIALIPYVTAWTLTGNPVFPFFNGVFKSPYFMAENFNNPFFNAGVTWDLPYRVIFDSGKYLESLPGVAGFQWLLLLPATAVLVAMLRSKRTIALLALGMIPIVVTFQAQSYLRYIFPSIAILTGLTAWAWEAQRNGLVSRRLWALAGTAAVALNLLFLGVGSFYRDFNLYPLQGSAFRQTYLGHYLPIRNAIQVVNSLNTTRAPVAVLASGYAAELAADVHYANWYNFDFHGAVHRAKSEQEMADVLFKRGIQYVIVDATTSQAVSPDKRMLVERATEPVYEAGTVSVRTVRLQYQNRSELLHNSRFEALDAWDLHRDVKVNEQKRSIVVDVTAVATQVIEVEPSKRYIQTVIARCVDHPTSGRMQVMWLDAKGKMIHPDIQIFECAPDWSEHSMKITSPAKAAFGVVYASGHTPIPVEFRKVSLK